MRSRKISMYNVGGDMTGNPVTLESISAMAKERLGKDPKMLSKLSFSGDLSNLSEEDVDKLLGLVESLQGDKGAIFDPEKRKELKRTIQSLQGSIGLDMDTTKSNIFSAWDDDAGFMEKPLVAAKKMAVDSALEKIMNEELGEEDDVPKMPLGGNLGNFFGNLGNQGGGGGGFGGFGGGGSGTPGEGSEVGVDQQGNQVSYINGAGPFGNAVQTNMQNALALLPQQFQDMYNTLSQTNPQMASQMLAQAIEAQGGMQNFLGDQWINPMGYGPNSDKPGAGPGGGGGGGDLGNFFGNLGNQGGGGGGGNLGNFFDNLLNNRPGGGGGGGGNLGDFFDNLRDRFGGDGQGGGGGGGQGGGGITVVNTFKDRSQIPAGFSLNKEKGGMLRKPRVYKLGGEMEDTSSDWDNPQGNGQGFSWGGGSTYGDIPTPQEMMGSLSAFEQYAPGASAQLMREYGDILAEQRAAEAAAAGEGEGGGGVGIDGLTDADMAYLEMLPPAERMKEMNKLKRLQERQERKDKRKEERGAGKSWSERTAEEKKNTLKEGLIQAGLFLGTGGLGNIARGLGFFEEGGDMNKRGGFSWGGERTSRPRFRPGTTSTSNDVSPRRRTGASLVDPASIFDRYRPKGGQSPLFSRMRDGLPVNEVAADELMGADPMGGFDRSGFREAMQEARQSGELEGMSFLDRMRFRRAMRDQFMGGGDGRNQGIDPSMIGMIGSRGRKRPMGGGDGTATAFDAGPDNQGVGLYGTMGSMGSKPSRQGLTLGDTSPRPQPNQDQVYPERYLRPYMKMGGDLFRYKKLNQGGPMGDPKKKRYR